MYSDISELVGCVFHSVTEGGDSLLFEGDRSFRIYHEQDCCESVTLVDITGDLFDLVGTPIVVAEERFGETGVGSDGYAESETFQFYEFRTIKGSVTIQFYGESNGYYNETAHVYEV